MADRAEANLQLFLVKAVAEQVVLDRDPARGWVEAEAAEEQLGVHREKLGSGKEVLAHGLDTDPAALREFLRLVRRSAEHRIR